MIKNFDKYSPVTEIMVNKQDYTDAKIQIAMQFMLKEELVINAIRLFRKTKRKIIKKVTIEKDHKLKQKFIIKDLIILSLKLTNHLQ